MAIDVYLQIDGIKGESTDSTHKDWIELNSAQWGVIQPKSATASTGGGHTAERCELRSIAVMPRQSRPQQTQLAAVAFKIYNYAGSVC